MAAPTVFISYSHKDEEWKNGLLPHFAQLQMADVLRVWDDRQIKQGEDWYARIKQVLTETEFAVCLISANYLSSQFCLNEEVGYLLQQRRKGGGRRLHILPVLVSDCVWQAHAWLRRLQMFPRDGRNLEEHFAGEKWSATTAATARSNGSSANSNELTPTFKRARRRERRRISCQSRCREPASSDHGRARPRRLARVA